jgi:hypothetical protein
VCCGSEVWTPAVFSVHYVLVHGLHSALGATFLGSGALLASAAVLRPKGLVGFGTGHPPGCLHQ